MPVVLGLWSEVFQGWAFLSQLLAQALPPDSWSAPHLPALGPWRGCSGDGPDKESRALGPLLVGTGYVTLGCRPRPCGFKGTLLAFSAGKYAGLLRG